MTAWTLDLFSRQAIVAPDVLVAMRAGEFEFAHGVNGAWVVDCPDSYSIRSLSPITNFEPSFSAAADTGVAR